MYLTLEQEGWGWFFKRGRTNERVNCNAKFLLLKYVCLSMQCTKQQFL